MCLTEYKNMPSYENISCRIRKFFQSISDFSEDYYAVTDHACCMSCGHNEIEDVRDNDPIGDYSGANGYIFYHMQETDSIKEQCKKNEPIKVHLCYGFFGDDDKPIQTYRTMYKTIKLVAKNYNMDLDWCGKRNEKMILTVNL